MRLPSNGRDHRYKAGTGLMEICDGVLGMINEAMPVPQEFNYLRRCIGLRAQNGSVRNFIHFSPKPTKKLVHVTFQNEGAVPWRERFEAAGVPASSRRKGRVRVSLSREEFDTHRALVKEAVADTVAQQVG